MLWKPSVSLPGLNVSLLKIRASVSVRRRSSKAVASWCGQTGEDRDEVGVGRGVKVLGAPSSSPKGESPKNGDDDMR